MDEKSIQTEIIKALELLSQKTTFTEAIIAKKIRENNKIETMKKAAISLSDLIPAINSLEEKNIFYSIHINSVNEILLKKESEHKKIDCEAQKRRQKAENSMIILTTKDLLQNKKQYTMKKR